MPVSNLAGQRAIYTCEEKYKVEGVRLSSALSEASARMMGMDGITLTSSPIRHSL